MKQLIGVFILTKWGKNDSIIYKVTNWKDLSLKLLTYEKGRKVQKEWQQLDGYRSVNGVVKEARLRIRLLVLLLI